MLGKSYLANIKKNLNHLVALDIPVYTISLIFWGGAEGTNIGI